MQYQKIKITYERIKKPIIVTFLHIFLLLGYNIWSTIKHQIFKIRQTYGLCYPSVDYFMLIVLSFLLGGYSGFLLLSSLNKKLKNTNKLKIIITNVVLLTIIMTIYYPFFQTNKYINHNHSLLYILSINTIGIISHFVSINEYQYIYLLVTLYVVIPYIIYYIMMHLYFRFPVRKP